MDYFFQLDHPFAHCIQFSNLLGAPDEVGAPRTVGVQESSILFSWTEKAEGGGRRAEGGGGGGGMLSHHYLLILFYIIFNSWIIECLYRVGILL